ncbi:hypothetical protein BB559_004190, partial [Furculomyces boomerangus]
SAEEDSKDVFEVMTNGTENVSVVLVSITDVQEEVSVFNKEAESDVSEEDSNHSTSILVQLQNLFLFK